MRKQFNLIFPLVCIVILLWIEQGAGSTYIVKTLSKSVLFLLIPIFLYRKLGFPFMNLRKTKSEDMRIAVFSGFAITFIIIASFIILKPFIDIDSLLVELNSIGVTSKIFPFVALYILFGNSLLEEFFFRGLLPNLFKQSRFRLFFPSFLFAIYHVAIFLTWFTLPLLVLAVIGLWIGGLVFQLANKRSGTILPSWTIHMFADVGVLLIGVYIFYIY